MSKTIVEISNGLEIVGFIKSNGTACRFVSMICETPVKKIRKDNPFPGLVKVSKKIGMINVDYVESVKRKISNVTGTEIKDVEYEAGKCWYKHLMTGGDTPKPLPIVVNKTKDDGKHYLQYFPTKSSNCYKLPSGEIVPDEKVKEYLYKESERTDLKPAVLSIDVNNIKRLCASGIIMQTEDIDEAEKSLDEISIDIGTGKDKNELVEV